MYRATVYPAIRVGNGAVIESGLLLALTACFYYLARQGSEALFRAIARLRACTYGARFCCSQRWA